MSQVLQALRLKGRATADELATSLGVAADDVSAELSSLAGERLVVERTTGRRPGWMLTGDGRDRYEATVAQARTPEVVERLTETYTSFLHPTSRSRTCRRSGRTPPTTRRASRSSRTSPTSARRSRPASARQARSSRKFGAYADRLAASLDKAADDHRYVVSPAVDSFHTVWFECHEDYLLMLGRTREQEGSW